MRKHRVLFITRKLNYSGAVRVLWEILKKINKEKFEVFLLVDGVKDIAFGEINSLGIEIKFMPASRWDTIIKGRIKWMNNKKERKLAYQRIIREIQPDILYFNTNGNTQLLEWSKSINSIKVCHLHGVGEGILYQGYNKRGQNKRVAHKRLSLTKEVLDYYVACSDACKRVLLDNPYNLKDTKIHVFPESISLEKVNYNESEVKRIENRYRTNKDTSVLVCAGNFHYRKGPDILLNTFLEVSKRGKDINLIWVGGEKEEYLNSPYMKKVREEITSHGVEDRIFFVGYKKNVYDYIAAADIFMLCSRDECLPLSILEAMKLGTPIVATNVGGVSEAIKNQYSGLLAESENVDQLAYMLLKLLDDKRLQINLSKNATKTVMNKFDVDIHIRLLEKFLLEVMGT